MTRRDAGATWRTVGWWTVFAICTLYGLFALTMGALQLLAILGVAGAVHRATPTVFVVHALAGGVVLLCGPLQFSERLRSRFPRAHRAVGSAYILGVWVSALAAVRVAVAFDVVSVAKIQFVVLALLWFGTTTVGLVRIRRRDVASHRAWMLRSFALSFFFVTFSLWVPPLAQTGLPEAISYPIGLFLSWAPNLAVAEVWIRRSRSRAAARAARTVHEVAPA
jgi:hypothetical protein